MSEPLSKRRKMDNAEDKTLSDKILSDEIPIPNTEHGINNDIIIEYIEAHTNDSARCDCIEDNKLSDLTDFEQMLLFFLSMNYISIDDFLFSLKKSVELFEEKIKIDETTNNFYLYIPPIEEKSNSWVSEIVYHLMKVKPTILDKIEEIKKIPENAVILLCDDMIYSGAQLHSFTNSFPPFYLICPFTTGKQSDNITCFTYNHIMDSDLPKDLNLKLQRSIYFQHKIADSKSIDTQSFNFQDYRCFSKENSQMSIIKNCTVGQIKESSRESKCPKSPYKLGDDEKKIFLSIEELKNKINSLNETSLESRKISENAKKKTSKWNNI